MSTTMSCIFRLAVLFSVAIGPISVSAQDATSSGEHAVTSAIDSSARFEVLQSTLTALQTFKLDKQTGFVQLLVTGLDGNLTWESIDVEALQISPSRANRYQLFLSGMAGKFTFLLDTETGTCWNFVFSEDEKTKAKTYFFHKM